MARSKLHNKNFGKLRPKEVKRRKGTIARKKRSANETEKEQQKGDMGVIKVPLNKILRDDYAEVMNAKIEDYVQNGTEIMHLGYAVKNQRCI